MQVEEMSVHRLGINVKSTVEDGLAELYQKLYPDSKLDIKRLENNLYGVGCSSQSSVFYAVTQKTGVIAMATLSIAKRGMGTMGYVDDLAVRETCENQRGVLTTLLAFLIGEAQKQGVTLVLHRIGFDRESEEGALDQLGFTRTNQNVYHLRLTA